MQWYRNHDVDSPEFAEKPAPPVLRQALAAFGWGALTCILCFSILVLARALLPPQYLVSLTGLAKFKREMPLSLLLFWVLIYAPILETFLGQLLPLEILKRLGVGTHWSIFLAAIFWGVVHGLSGGLLHGIVALGSGAMFSFVYLRYREPGVAAAYATTAFARVCNNALVLIAVSFGVDS